MSSSHSATVSERALDQDLHWCLVRLVRGIGAAEVAAIEHTGLTVRGYILLRALGTEGASSQLTLAGTAMMDKSTLVRALDELEADGYVERGADPGDRRVRKISATKHGIAALNRAIEVIAEVEDQFLSGLTKTERAAFRKAATKLGTGPSAATFDARPSVI